MVSNRLRGVVRASPMSARRDRSSQEAADAGVVGAAEADDEDGDDGWLVDAAAGSLEGVAVVLSDVPVDGGFEAVVEERLSVL